MKTNCIQKPIEFQDLGRRKVTGNFDGGDISSDGVRYSNEFLVLDEMTEELIIGASTMQKWGIKLDMEQEKVELTRRDTRTTSKRGYAQMRRTRPISLTLLLCLLSLTLAGCPALVATDWENAQRKTISFLRTLSSASELYNTRYSVYPPALQSLSSVNMISPLVRDSEGTVFVPETSRSYSIEFEADGAAGWNAVAIPSDSSRTHYCISQNGVIYQQTGRPPDANSSPIR